jgi:hypothetical protein
MAWVRRSAETVTSYFGRFPVPSLQVTVMTESSGGLHWGQHWGGKRIRVWAGKETTERTLDRDWVLVHEMLHAAFPDLRRRHRWMQEGLSTYLEPVVRARAGHLTEREVWVDWVDSMHHGRPKRGDEGLDRTATWGRIYWGGALF